MVVGLVEYPEELVVHLCTVGSAAVAVLRIDSQGVPGKTWLFGYSCIFVSGSLEAHINLVDHRWGRACQCEKRPSYRPRRLRPVRKPWSIEKKVSKN